MLLFCSVTEDIEQSKEGKKVVGDDGRFYLGLEDVQKQFIYELRDRSALL